MYILNTTSKVTLINDTKGTMCMQVFKGYIRNIGSAALSLLIISL